MEDLAGSDDPANPRGAPVRIAIDDQGVEPGLGHDTRR